MHHFQSLEAIREADVDALADVPSMNRAAAEKYGNFSIEMKICLVPSCNSMIK